MISDRYQTATMVSEKKWKRWRWIGAVCCLFALVVSSLAEECYALSQTLNNVMVETNRESFIDADIIMNSSQDLQPIQALFILPFQKLKTGKRRKDFFVYLITQLIWKTSLSHIQHPRCMHQGEASQSNNRFLMKYSKLKNNIWLWIPSGYY